MGWNTNVGGIRSWVLLLLLAGVVPHARAAGPNPPQLQAPGHHEIFNRNRTNWVAFSWSAVPGSTGFRLNVFPSGDSPHYKFLGEVGNVTSHSLFVGNWDNGVYVWEASVKTTGDYGLFSGPDARHFIVDAPPPPPVLGGPFGGVAVTAGTSVAFFWDPPSGLSASAIDRYHFTIASAAGGAPIDQLVTSQQSVSIFLQPARYSNGSYTWGARAIKKTPPGYDPASYESIIGYSEPTSRALQVGDSAGQQVILSIGSSTIGGVSIGVSPVDSGGLGDGTTPFARSYAKGTTVTLTAPFQGGAHNFREWLKNGASVSTNSVIQVQTDVERSYTAAYDTPACGGGQDMVVPVCGMSLPLIIGPERSFCFQPGTYTLTGDCNLSGAVQITDVSDVIVEGNGAVLEGGSGQGRGIYINRAPRTVIRNLTLKNFGLAVFCQLSADVSIENVTIVNDTTGLSSGIVVTYSPRTTVRNSRIDLVEDAIRVYDESPAVLIEKNTVSRCGGSGIRASRASGIRVLNNTISETEGNCIWMDSCNESVIAGNSTSNGKVRSLILQSSTNVTIAGNNFTGSEIEGVQIGADSKTVVVKDNNIHSHGGPNLVNSTSNWIDARDNWWGTPQCGAITERLVGNIGVDTVLDAPYPDGHSVPCSQGTAARLTVRAFPPEAGPVRFTIMDELKNVLVRDAATPYSGSYDVGKKLLMEAPLVQGDWEYEIWVQETWQGRIMPYAVTLDRDREVVIRFLPATPRLELPADREIFNKSRTNSIKFTWTAVPGATDYEANIFPAGNSDNPKWQQAVGNVTELTLPISDWDIGEYVWEMRALTGWGRTSFSGSQARRFIVDLPPGPPRLTLPADGRSYEVGSLATFAWDPPSGLGIAGKYCFALPFSWTGSPSCDQTTTARSLGFTFSPAKFTAGPYTWGARALKVTPLGYDPIKYESVIGYGPYATRRVVLSPASATTQVLKGLVIAVDSQGHSKGAVAGATVEIPAAGAMTTNALGEYQFNNLGPGSFNVTVSKVGYFSVTRMVTLAAGETKQETFKLTAQSVPPSEKGSPSPFDFSSPGGRSFIEGMPGNLPFSIAVAWNGAAGSVYFHLAGTRYPATVVELGGGIARASLNVPIPAVISSCIEMTIEVVNGEGKKVFLNTGVRFFPVPEMIVAWYRDDIPWTPSGLAFTSSEQASLIWKLPFKWNALSFSVVTGLLRQLSYDPVSATFRESIVGTGKFKFDGDLTEMEIRGEGGVELTGSLQISLAGCGLPTITPAWKVSATGKAGAGFPVVLMADFIPPIAPAVHFLLSVPIVNEIVRGLRIRILAVGGFGLEGKYEGNQPTNCFLGTTSLDFSGTLGLEGQIAAKAFGAEAGVYAGLTGTPEYELCPDIAFKGNTFRGYVGAFASALLFEYRKEVGVELRLGDVARAILVEVPESASGGAWKPIGTGCVVWGPPNQPAKDNLRRIGPTGGAASEEAIIENVTHSASPSIVSRGSETTIVYSLHDRESSLDAIGTLRQSGGGAWSPGTIGQDPDMGFNPRVIEADPGTFLAVWQRVSGDVSGATEPGQVAPHLEIVTAWLDGVTGAWSTPESISINAVVDRDPRPVAFGSTRGVLWIQNESDAVPGDSTRGDALLFAKRSSSTWEAPVALWSGKMGILGFSFVADEAGEARVVFAVDQDGDNETRTDRDLHAVFTAGGVWQAAGRLTDDSVEDAIPALVAPDGRPICIWGAGGKLVYTAIDAWDPRPVFGDPTLSTDAPAIDGVTLPGGAAVAYTAQGESGTHIVASFYDARLDRWSLPRQLTQGNDVESSLSIASDGNEVVIAYLKTQTLPPEQAVIIDGETFHLSGRTDIYVLRHALGYDLAVVPGSLVLDPPNPVAGAVTTVQATVENRGDLSVEDITVIFYDGDPGHGGMPIGDPQTIPGTILGGEKQDVSSVWYVPSDPAPHEVYVVVDPALEWDDRDRSNNVQSSPAVQPDLAIETCWSTEVSSSTVALMARVINSGVLAAGQFDVSWRLGAADGEEIGKSAITSLAPGQAVEVSYSWDAAERKLDGTMVQVAAVADPFEAVQDPDRTNNVCLQSVVFRPQAAFMRGDSDGNAVLELTDAVRVLNFLFLGTGVINCSDAADADDNGQVELTDAVRILNFLFLGTGVIPLPGPPSEICGPDPTEDALDCTKYPPCE